MSRICLQLSIRLLSDTIISSGHSVPGGEDISLRLDDTDGRPILPGSTLKGLLLESIVNLLVWTGGDCSLPDKLFGTEGKNGGDERRLIFGTMRLNEVSDWSTTRTFTALTDGVAKKGSLRMASCIRRGASFSGVILCDEADRALVTEGLEAIKWMGLMRNRGFGRVRITVQKSSDNCRKSAPAANCLYYRLRLETPLAISYLRGSGDEALRNNTDTRKYLPGATLRGFVMDRLAAEDPEWFAAHKVELLSEEVSFLNAFPKFGEVSCIPTPVGFYEDKKETRIYHVLETGKVTPGDKRAKIGAFCVITQNEIRGGTPAITNNLRISRDNEKKMFTAKALASGTVLEGYILLRNAALAPKLASVFGSRIWLGAKRFAGNGLCAVEALKPVSSPHWMSGSLSARTTIPQVFYMLLLSPTAMSKDGEIVGMEEAQLAKLLGVQFVEITGCATSTTEIHSFNSTWHCEAPIIPMYESGSIFRLRCSTPPDAEGLRRIEMSGIGLRVAEGYGRVMFLDSLAGICRKGNLQPKKDFSSGTEAAVRRARCNWLLENDTYFATGLSASQLGEVQSLCERAIAQGGDVSCITDYFDKKPVEPKQRAAFKKLYDHMEKIWSKPLADTINVPVCEDSLVLRLQLIVELLNLGRKGGAKQ